MNNTFSFKRFGLVVKKDFMENQKRYILLFLTMLGLMALISVLGSLYFYSSKIYPYSYLIHNKALLGWMSLMFLSCGIFFSSSFSMPMNSKLKRIAYLDYPASNLEKYLTRWMITTVGYIIAFFIALWFADSLRVIVCSNVFPDENVMFLDLSRLTYPDETYKGHYLVPKFVLVIIVSIYFLIQSVFILGSTFWEKATFIKTFTAIGALIGVYVMLNRWAILLFYGDFDGFEKVLNSFQLADRFSENQAAIFTSIILSVFTLANWILAYFRINESEIIKRI